MADNNMKSLNKAIKIDEAEIKNHLSEMVRDTVEVTLNNLLDAEAQALCQAQRYERTEQRKDSRAGYYERGLETTAGKVNLKVPKLRQSRFETAIIERYQRRESSVEEALIEMYLAGVSVRRVEDITQALWGTRVSPATVSKLNQKAYAHIEAWRNRPIVGSYAYVYLDGIVLKRCWAGEVRHVSVLVAIGVDQEGYRQVLGVAEGEKEDKAGWGQFIKHLKERGLAGISLFVSDGCIGLVESMKEYYPQARWQRCCVHFYRNVFAHVPRTKVREVASMLKAIHAQEDSKAAQEKAKSVSDKLKLMKLPKAAEWVDNYIQDTLSYYHFPSQHWRKIKTNNPLERIMREIRRRTQVVGAFPDGQSALMLSAARLRHVASTRWGTKKYMDMNLLKEMTVEQAVA